MQITATFESIEEMRSFAMQMAGEVKIQARTAKLVKKPENVQKQQEPDPEPQDKSEPQQDPKPEPQEEEETEVTEVTEETVQEETAYTLEEVRAKLAELNKAGKRAAVKALLTSFGASKLSEIPASKYAVLMVKAGGL